MTITDGIIKIYLSTTSPYPVTFTWTVVQTGTVSGATAGTGDVIDQTVTGIGTITYRVTATEIATGCKGEPVDILITIQEEGLIGNEYQSQLFYCEDGETTEPYLYEVPADTFFADTLEEANDLALADILANGQSEANAHGVCASGSCIGYSLSNIGTFSIEYFDCDGNFTSGTFSSPINICTDGSGYNITSGSAEETGSSPCP